MKDFKNYLSKYFNLIDEVLKIDNKKWNENIDINQINEKLDLKIDLEEGKTYLIIYDGNPRLTKFILEQAIRNKSNIVFTIYDYYLATNETLISIAKKYSKDNKINIFLKLYNNIYEDKIFENTRNVDETIYIGEKQEFNFIEANVQSKLTKIEF